MPLDKNGYGSSNHTPEKMADFRGIVRMLAGICAGQVWCPLYVYIDMNAGPGVVPGLGIAGSPRVFVETAQEFHLRYSAHLIESNPASIMALSESVGHEPNVTIYSGDHNRILPRIVPALGHSTGLIYHDPNGEPSFETLAVVSRMPQAQRLDMLIHVTAAGLKRINGWRARRDIPFQTLLDSIHTISKTRWIVQEPSGNWQWTFLLGTNWGAFPEWKRRGFYALDSDKGREIIGRLAYPEDERAGYFGQMDLLT